MSFQLFPIPSYRAIVSLASLFWAAGNRSRCKCCGAWWVDLSSSWLAVSFFSIAQQLSFDLCGCFYFCCCCCCCWHSLSWCLWMSHWMCCCSRSCCCDVVVHCCWLFDLRSDDDGGGGVQLLAVVAGRAELSEAARGWSRVTLCGWWTVVVGGESPLHSMRATQRE